MAEVVTLPKLDGDNSHRERSSLDSPIEKPSVELAKPTLKGTVIQKKPSFAVRLKETFIAEDVRDVGDYILWDILIPTIKRTIRDIIVGSADRIFLGVGTTQASHLRREHGITYVSPKNYSVESTRLATSKTTQTVVPSGYHAVIDFGVNNIVFDHYEDASSILDYLVDYLETYGQVTVADYFEAAGRSAPYTAQRWGWKTLASATIQNCVGGYFIKLPKPIELKG